MRGLVEKVLIIFQMLVGIRGVADDAKRQEWNGKQVAYLCKAARFHIHCQGFGIGVFYFAELVPVVDKLVAGANKAAFQNPAPLLQ